MEGIKNIIFDLGAVILNIDYQLTIDAFVELGVTDFGDIFSKAGQSEFMDDFETGKVSEAEFLDYARPKCRPGVRDLEIIEAWNAMILEFPLDRLELLQQVALHYETFMLSNTNETHMRCYNQVLMDTCGIQSMDYFFNKAYLSHQIGHRKPNPEAFEIILRENELNAAETLFIDDSPQHIETAKKLGLRAIHLTMNKTLEDDVFKPKV